MTQVGNIIRLSFRDYTHEWRMSGCFVAALAAVLAPLMILFGLKFGIVSSMVTQLIENPINREIRPIGSGHYDQRWFEPNKIISGARTAANAATKHPDMRHSWV